MRDYENNYENGVKIMWCKSMTKEEKSLVKAICKLHYVKGWQKPEEFEIYKQYDINDRDELEEFINKIWNELNI